MLYNEVHAEFAGILSEIYTDQDALPHFVQVLHTRIATPPPSPSPSEPESDASLWGQVDPITPAHELAAAVAEQYGRVPFNFVNGQSLALGE